jgi:hypothetical protein
LEPKGKTRSGRSELTPLTLIPDDAKLFALAVALSFAVDRRDP